MTFRGAAVLLALACLGAGPLAGRQGPSTDDTSTLAAPHRPMATTDDPRSVGMEPAALERVDAIITTAIADHATPGAALAVGRHGKLVRLRGYGALDYGSDAGDVVAGAASVTDSTLYDLASLSKVIGTTTAVMILVDEGKLDLDAPASRYLPELKAPGKAAITVRQLMMHDAGLPGFEPYYRDTRGRKAYLARIAAQPLAYAPGTKTVYSDLGMILTGLVVEKVAGTTLDRFLEDRVFGPLGMTDTGYDPLATSPIPAGSDCTAAYRADDPLLARIAPTEVDTYYRHMHVHGIVHDENACAMGGVAGHAGLFSSARDLATFAQMLLNGGTYGGRRIVSARTVAEFTRRQSAASSRAIGWDTPGPGPGAGHHFGARSFGHTGFTGTSIWVDPERDVFVVLLTNRVDPTRDNPKIGPLRRAVADAVARGITTAGGTR